MKTAEDILCETETAFVNDCRTLFEWEDVIKAMKIYANQKLDEAAKKANIKDEENCDHWYEILPFPEVDKESILSLKDQI